MALPSAALRVTAHPGPLPGAVWAATSPESGRFCPDERHTDLRGLSDRFGELRSRGQGYLEVGLPGAEFPWLSMGFRGDHAVVHLLEDAGAMSLRVGDGTVPPGVVAGVPVMDGLAEFTGGFVLGVDRAWAVVQDFVRTGVPGEGGWCEL